MDIVFAWDNSEPSQRFVIIILLLYHALTFDTARKKVSGKIALAVPNEEVVAAVAEVVGDGVGDGVMKMTTIGVVEVLEAAAAITDAIVDVVEEGVTMMTIAHAAGGG